MNIALLSVSLHSHLKCKSVIKLMTEIHKDFARIISGREHEDIAWAGASLLLGIPDNSKGRA